MCSAVQNDCPTSHTKDQIVPFDVQAKLTQTLHLQSTRNTINMLNVRVPAGKIANSSPNITSELI